MPRTARRAAKGEGHPGDPRRAGHLGADGRDRDAGRLLDREPTHAGPERRDRERLDAQLAGRANAVRTARSIVAASVRRAWSERDGVDDPARGERPGRGHDRVTQADRSLADGRELDRVAAPALDRARDTGRHPQAGARRAHDRVHLEVTDVAVPERDLRHGPRSCVSVRMPTASAGAVYTRGRRADIAATTSQLIVVRSCASSRGGDPVAALLAEEDELVVGRDRRPGHVGDIGHHGVHRDGAHERDPVARGRSRWRGSPAAGSSRPRSRSGASRSGSGGPSRSSGHTRCPRRSGRSATRTGRAWSERTGPQRTRGSRSPAAADREPVRRDPVERQPDPQTVEDVRRSPPTYRSTASRPPDASRWRCGAGSAGRGQRRRRAASKRSTWRCGPRRVLGRLEMRPGAVEVRPGHVRQRAHGRDRLVGRQPVAAEPGLDPDVDGEVAEPGPGAPARAGIGGQAARPEDGVAGRQRDPAAGGLRDAVRRDREEDEDRRPQAGRAELERLVQRRDAEAARTGRERDVGDRDGAVAVGVGLDDGLDPRCRPAAPPRSPGRSPARRSRSISSQAVRGSEGSPARPEAGLDRRRPVRHPAGRPKPSVPRPARRSASTVSRWRARAISTGRSPARSPASPRRCRTASPAMPWR